MRGRIIQVPRNRRELVARVMRLQGYLLSLIELLAVKSVITPEEAESCCQAIDAIDFPPADKK